MTWWLNWTLTMSVKYVFFVAGHLLVHPPLSAKLERYTTPFDMVVTLDRPIEDDKGLERLRTQVEAEGRRQLNEAAPNHLLADVTIRGVSLLHTLQD